MPYVILQKLDSTVNHSPFDQLTSFVSSFGFRILTVVRQVSDLFFVLFVAIYPVSFIGTYEKPKKKSYNLGIFSLTFSPPLSNRVKFDDISTEAG